MESSREGGLTAVGSQKKRHSEARSGIKHIFLWGQRYNLSKAAAGNAAVREWYSAFTASTKALPAAGEKVLQS